MSIYVVSRVFTKKERPDTGDRKSFYGWSKDKSTVKAFLKQRTRGKYSFVKYNEEDINKSIIDELVSNSSDSMIDFMKLTVASSKEVVRFYTTMREMKEAEIKIQEKYHDMCSIPDAEVLKLYMALDPYYLDAVQFLGFRPKEVDYLFDGASPVDGFNTCELTKYEIESAYDGECNNPSEFPWRFMNPPGLGIISTVADKILYSLENFISVLRDEL